MDTTSVLSVYSEGAVTTGDGAPTETSKELALITSPCVLTSLQWTQSNYIDPNLPSTGDGLEGELQAWFALYDGTTPAGTDTGSEKFKIASGGDGSPGTPLQSITFPGLGILFDVSVYIYVPWMGAPYVSSTWGTGNSIQSVTATYQLR